MLQKSEKSLQIYKEYTEGKGKGISYNVLARKYGISPQRVNEIIKSLTTKNG